LTPTVAVLKRLASSPINTRASGNEDAWVLVINQSSGKIHHHFTTSFPDAVVAFEKCFVSVEAAVQESAKT
ncbi:hypothetical protein AHF37_12775, partial [Paragonimus kellicotti]